VKFPGPTRHQRHFKQKPRTSASPPKPDISLRRTAQPGRSGRGEPQRGEPQRGELQQGEPPRGEPHRGEPPRGEPHGGVPLQGRPRALLFKADLSGAYLIEANLGGAGLSGALLGRANLFRTNLTGANLSGANLSETVFGNVNLTSVIGLETCEHGGPSIIDHRTLERSGPLPLSFLRGVGLPDNWIESLPSLLNQAIQHYSCFISYSTKDQEFAERLHADLQKSGVRCWFAPHDLRIGDKTWDAIDEAIKLRDKLLLILSKNAINSDWVEDEVQKAFAEERDRKQHVLFPVRLDDAAMETPEPWARELRDQRNIGDFRHWKDHDAYKDGFERVLRDLTIKS
jgi:hypothetical protein